MHGSWRVTSNETIQHYEREGWRVLDWRPANATSANRDTLLPAVLEQGQTQSVVDIRREEKQTRPPRRFSEATLLTAMETAGRSLDDDELPIRELGSERRMPDQHPGSRQHVMAWSGRKVVSSWIEPDSRQLGGIRR